MTGNAIFAADVKWLFSIVGLYVVVLVCPGQTLYPAPGSKFSAFGSLPIKTPDSLLAGWHAARDIDEWMVAAQALIHFHETAGTHDSVIFYAREMQRRVAQSALNQPAKLRYTASAGNALARAYQEKGLYEEALRHYLGGITAGEQLADPAIVDQNRFGNATVYFLRKEYRKAIPIYEEIRTQSKDTGLVQQINKQLGKAYLAQRQLQRADEYLSLAQHYFAKTGELKQLLETQLYQARVAEAGGRSDSAFAMYEEVKERALEHRYFDTYIQAGQRMGDILMAQKDYHNAQILLSMVYVNAMQWEDLEAQRDALNSLQQLHAAIGDYENAYALMSQYRRVSGEIAEQQNRREVNELEVKYLTAQKEKEIIVKESELGYQKTVKYALLIGFIVVLIPVIGLLYVYYQKLQAQSRLNAIREEASRQQIGAMLKEKELELLAASVAGQETERKRIARELHDSIGGNLAAIKMQLSLTGRDTIDLVEKVDETYQQVRDLSHNLLPQKFTNVGFTVLIETYLQGFRTVPETAVTFRAYPEAAINALPTPLKVVVYTIIQELMTNAHKHAKAAQVTIQLTRIDGALVLIFEDDGKGFNTESTAGGIGLRNIRERLKPHGGTMAIDSKPGRGTVIDIEIPLNHTTHEA